MSTDTEQCVLSAGFNPVWYDTLRFTIHTPELAMVRFVVEDYDKTSKNDFVGQYTLPLSCMQQGKLEETELNYVLKLWLINERYICLFQS